MLNYIVLGFPTNTIGQGNIGKKEVKLHLLMSLIAYVENVKRSTKNKNTNICS